jgi:ribosome assembly protein 1
VGKIVATLGLKIKPQDLRSKDTHNLLVAIFSQWLPLAPATFRAIVERVPPPGDAQALRTPKMLHPELPHSHAAPPPSTDLERDLYAANTAPGSVAVAYVSKMFAVPSRDLPHNQRRQLTADEMRERGRILRAAGTAPAPLDPDALPPSLPKAAAEDDGEVTGETLIGFSRLYSGVLRVGQAVYCVLPKYVPGQPFAGKHVVVATLSALYMLMGRELVAVDEVPAGNVFGACGLEGKVLRNATICVPPGGGEVSMDRWEADAATFVNLAGFRLAVRRRRFHFVEQSNVGAQSAPIVRVALEPTEPCARSLLQYALRLDHCAQPRCQSSSRACACSIRPIPASRRSSKRLASMSS